MSGPHLCEPVPYDLLLLVKLSQRFTLFIKPC